LKKLVVIPARGGSKGLPGKNIKLLHGKPLIHYTIEAAREVFDDSDIIVSTDSIEIKTVAELTGLIVPFLRPVALATDTSSSQDVLMHALDYYSINFGKPDVVILLQVTSPLRTSIHIKSALEMYSEDIDMVVSVKKTDANPYYVLFEENESGFLEKSKKSAFTRRQDCPQVWELNGAIYIINSKSLESKQINDFNKLIKYPMDKLSSVDIDDIIDFELASLLLEREGQFLKG